MVPTVVGVFVLIISGIFFNRISEKNNVAGVSMEATSNPSPTSRQESEESISSTSKVNINVNANSNSSNNKINKISVDINDFKYPGASINSQSGNFLEMDSLDNPDNITNWYKEKISSLGMNTKSFVVTKTNDNILNKLAGDNGSLEVVVEIKKSAGENLTKIKVNFILD